MRPRHPQPPRSFTRRRQLGATLIEALLSFLILSLGMLAVARLQSHLRLTADVARQRSEAVRLAQEDIERLRAFASIGGAAAGPTSSGISTYDAIASVSTSVDSTTGDASATRYDIAREIVEASAGNAKTASVSVSWTDRNGQAQRVSLESIVARADPAYGGALGLVRHVGQGRDVFARSSRIPREAKDLGNGTSAFKPVPGGSIVFVFANATGLLTQRCAGVGSTIANVDLTLGNLGSCAADIGALLSGTVRFTSSSPPSTDATDAVLDAAVALTTSGGVYASAPFCVAGVVMSRTGKQHLAYHCVVYPLANGRWSGRVSLVPSGWRIGIGAAEHRVCRFTSDLDGSGAIDTNLEHPAAYSAVNTPLVNQNYLVVKGTESCPTGERVTVAGHGSDVFADLGTAQHQP